MKEAYETLHGKIEEDGESFETRLLEEAQNDDQKMQWDMLLGLWLTK